MTLSSLGFGSYLGDATDEADAAYAAAFETGLAGGVNVVDTAANYRGRRSERAVGAALAGLPREEVLVATKGGFLSSTQQLNEYLDAGVVARADVAMGCHAMSPTFLEAELEKSLDALQLDAVDVYLLHNPESQLDALPRPAFEERLRAAFGFLETARREGRIGVYGLATWFALRVPPGEKAHIGIERALEVAREVGGPQHGFAAVELPYNLAMREAARAPTQPWEGRLVPALDAARAADLLVLGSATLMQGQLLRRMPPPVRARLSAHDDAALAAIQFSRSTPGMTCALVGTGSPAHARHNLRATQEEPRPAVAAELLGA